MTPLHPGDQLDSYRVENLVARGGMASVFRGMDLRTGAHVAIKVPHPEAECDPVFFERFHREATIGREMALLSPTTPQHRPPRPTVRASANISA